MPVALHAIEITPDFIGQCLDFGIRLRITALKAGRSRGLGPDDGDAAGY
jgi:hypothetical protein